MAPTVSFQGPNQVPAGTTAAFQFVVQSQATAAQTYAGFDVAASSGKLTAGQNQYAILGEVTHVSPKANDAQGVATWQFTWQAPATPGSYTLFGAGNSVNHDGSFFGDRCSATTLMVMVAAPAATPTSTSIAIDTPTPTPTATPLPCIGDCNHNQSVGLDEILTGVDVAMGGMPADPCPAFDVNQIGRITVADLLAAINDALIGCPRP